MLSDNIDFVLPLGSCSRH